MTFQVLDNRENHFLKLLDNDYLSIKHMYTKDGSWLSQISHSNSLCTKVTKAITNHIPIGEYCLRFFLKMNFEYLYRLYIIKSRQHMLWCAWILIFFSFFDLFF